MDCLMFMRVKKTGTITQTAKEWGRQTGCSPARAVAYAKEIERHEIADVTISVRKLDACGTISARLNHVEITVTSRRYDAEFTSRKLADDRRLRYLQRKRDAKATAEGRQPDAKSQEDLLLPLSVQLPTAPTTPTEPEKKQSTALVVSQDETTPEAAFTRLGILWNECPKAQVHHLRSTDAKAPENRDRMKRLRKALTDGAAWAKSAEEAIRVIQSGGCSGWFGNNDRGWKPSFGFLFERDKLGKILDGTYAPAAGEGQRAKTRLEKELESL
jgi:hypothetical protein